MRKEHFKYKRTKTTFHLITTTINVKIDYFSRSACQISSKLFSDVILCLLSDQLLFPASFSDTFKRQPHKMAKYTYTVRRLLLTSKRFVSVTDHFLGLALRGLNQMIYNIEWTSIAHCIVKNKSKYWGCFYVVVGVVLKTLSNIYDGNFRKNSIIDVRRGPNL